MIIHQNYNNLPQDIINIMSLNILIVYLMNLWNQNYYFKWL